MNVLVSSAGRRGALIRLIRETLQPMGGQVYAIDATSWSSACRLADGWSIVPRFDDEQFFDTVATFCHRHGIQLILPTHDRELPVYAKLRPLFAEIGIHVACSGPLTVAIASDKCQTDCFLRDNQLPTVPRFSLSTDWRASPELPFPLIVKPRRGSGSIGVHIAYDVEELEFYLKRTEAPIVQQKVDGREFTTNVLIGNDRKCRVAVPHLRVETRGGEVSKCITVRHAALMGLANRIAAALPDAYGPLCFQAFISGSGVAQIIELNARFGGGYPVAHCAGADFVRLIIDELHGRVASASEWTDGLAMTRWDDAVFWHTKESQHALK